MLTRSIQIYTTYPVYTQQSAWQPPTDVYETEREVLIRVEIAGMRDGHFHLTCHERLIVIDGARSEIAREQRAYQQMEIHSGDFRIEVELPARVNLTALRAEYDDGFLRIVLPKLN